MQRIVHEEEIRSRGVTRPVKPRIKSTIAKRTAGSVAGAARERGRPRWCATSTQRGKSNVETQNRPMLPTTPCFHLVNRVYATFLSLSLLLSLRVRVYPLSISLIHPCAWTNLLIENLERRSCDIMDDRLDIVQRKIINSRSFVSSMDGITVNLVWLGEAC